jgi:hemerythrin
MKWSEEFSVGIAVFDDEHKKLIDLINRLYASATGGGGKLELQRISDELVDYTLNHFRHEEAYFDEWCFPGAQEHIARHQQLQHQVFEYRKQIQGAQGPELALEMLRFLCDWLERHIMIDDRKFGHFLLQKGIC